MLKNRNTLAKSILFSAALLFLLFSNGAIVHSASMGTMNSFSLPSLKGENTVSSSSLKGKVVLIDFWASWCVPCEASFPAYNDLYNMYKDKGFEIIGINIDDNKDKALEFLNDHPANFTILSEGKKTAEAFGLETMPTSYLIDRTGNIVYINSGFHEEDINKIEKKIESVL